MAWWLTALKGLSAIQSVKSAANSSGGAGKIASLYGAYQGARGTLKPQIEKSAETGLDVGRHSRLRSRVFDDPSTWVKTSENPMEQYFIDWSD